MLCNGWEEDSTKSKIGRVLSCLKPHLKLSTYYLLSVVEMMVRKHLKLGLLRTLFPLVRTPGLSLSETLGLYYFWVNTSFHVTEGMKLTAPKSPL